MELVAGIDEHGQQLRDGPSGQCDGQDCMRGPLAKRAVRGAGVDDDRREEDSEHSSEEVGDTDRALREALARLADSGHGHGNAERQSGVSLGYHP